MKKKFEDNDFYSLYLKFQEIYEIIYPLIPKKNTCKELFGQILEGVIRKDFFTMQTMLVLIDQIKIDRGNLIVFSGSILDLSRRIFEDSIAMVYINLKGKAKYSKRLIDYIAVEDKADIDFLDFNKLHVDDNFRNEVEEKYLKLSKETKGRKNWAGLDIEGMIDFIAQKTNMPDFQKQIVLKEYMHGNRKNHVSSIDVWTQGSSDQEILERIAEGDISMALITASQSILWVSMFFGKEEENPKEIQDKLYDFWKKLNNGKMPNENILNGKE